MMSLTRRAFIKTTAVVPFIAYAAPVAASDPATILAAMAAFQKILQYQSQRGDGGSGALLGAINNKVDIIISQLATIEAALAQITIQIAQMREEVLKAIGQQHAIELFNETKAALVAITDIQREARSKRISLDVRNPDRQGLEIRLEHAWREFDQSRRRLREYPQGRGMLSATLLDAFVLADQSAFAAGLIDETGFAIILEHHVNWLKQMVEPSLDFSVSAYARQAAYDEAAERSSIEKSSKTDPASAVAFGLLSQPTTHICSITYMDVKFWSAVPYSDWYKIRGNRYLIVPIYSVERADVHGASVFRNVTYQTYKIAQVILGNGHLHWAFGDVASVDQKKCLTFSNPESVIDSLVMTQFRIDRESHDSSTFKKGIGGLITSGFITKSGFARTTTTGGIATAGEAQKLLDRVNLHIMNRRLAEMADKSIAGNRDFAANLAAALPTVPR